MEQSKRMTVRVAINGFGRIGRSILRALVETQRKDIHVVSINDLGKPEYLAHLLRFDSVHGRFPGTVDVQGESLVVNGTAIQVTALRDPAELPHKKLNVDVALECTGIFSSKDKAVAHCQAGARRVLVSAPSEGADLTVVYGVNHKALTAEHVVVSNASCTTNCLAPIVKVLHELVGIEHGFMTTIHAYTNDQPVLDQMHRDLYRARAATLSMIPTTTGAARAVGLVLPELKGKIDGTSIRVPVPNVSAVDLKALVKRPTTIEELNGALKAAADGPLSGILGYTEAPNVSVDFNQDTHSSIVAFDQTKVVGGTFIRIMSWYDNETGFSHRMLDTAVLLGKLAQ
jgi:glyceraldehyde 3-phosphate dehydrogenase